MLADAHRGQRGLRVNVQWGGTEPMFEEGSYDACDRLSREGRRSARWRRFGTQRTVGNPGGPGRAA